MAKASCTKSTIRQCGIGSSDSIRTFCQDQIEAISPGKLDPETWVRWDYAVVRVDSRGAGRSPGYLDIFSPRETLDYYHAIEWAGMRPWSNGRVGLNGISYYAINQWHVAALQPPHLTAMVPWEGAADSY